jgi:uncharacterized protein (DUF736 family)
VKVIARPSFCALQHYAIAMKLSCKTGRAKLAVGYRIPAVSVIYGFAEGRLMSHAPAKKAASRHVSVRRDPPFLPKPLNAPLFPTNEAGGQSLVWDRKNPDAE